MTDQPQATRRRGNPMMRRGAPSVNPHGRPPVGRSLAAAIRQRITPRAIVSLALQIVDNEEAPAPTRLRALELLAARGYGRLAQLAEHLPEVEAELEDERSAA